MKLLTTFKQRHTVRDGLSVVSVEGLPARNAPFACVKNRGQYWDAKDCEGLVRVFTTVAWKIVKEVEK